MNLSEFINATTDDQYLYMHYGEHKNSWICGLNIVPFLDITDLTPNVQTCYSGSFIFYLTKKIDKNIISVCRKLSIKNTIEESITYKNLNYDIFYYYIIYYCLKKITADTLVLDISLNNYESLKNKIVDKKCLIIIESQNYISTNKSQMVLVSIDVKESLKYINSKIKQYDKLLSNQ